MDDKQFLHEDIQRLRHHFVIFQPEVIPGIDFGKWTPVIVAVNSVIVNIVRKVITRTG